MGEMNVDNIIPLGRSMKEYINMFLLDESSLNKKILDCGGGSSSFNFEMYSKGYKTVTIDPIYKYDKKNISQQIDYSFNNVLEKAAENKFIWNDIKSVEHLKKIRMDSMNKFLTDYEHGKKDGRYIQAKLPELPFASKQFDIVLCSHLLFLYSNKLSYDFHRKAITEMLRVANEVRIFPIIDLNSKISPHLDKILNFFNKKKKKIIIETVKYEFQKGAFRQLIISN